MIGDRFDSSFLSFRTVPNVERPRAISRLHITINPAYIVAAMGFDFKVHDALTAYVRGDNIGDTAYDSALGYRGLPRAVVFGARFHFATRSSG